MLTITECKILVFLVRLKFLRHLLFFYLHNADLHFFVRLERALMFQHTFSSCCHADRPRIRRSHLTNINTLLGRLFVWLLLQRFRAALLMVLLLERLVVRISRCSVRAHTTVKFAQHVDDVLHNL